MSLGISGLAISSRRIDVRSGGIDLSDEKRERERGTVSIEKRFYLNLRRPKVMYLFFLKLQIRARVQINDST